MLPAPPTPPRPTIVCGCSALTSEADLRRLLAAGVGEVFVGYVPEAWRDRLGHEVSPNRRYEPERQLRDRDQLRRVAEIVAGAGARLVVALNEHGFGPEARSLVPEIVEHALDAGAGGFILAEAELLADLRRQLGGRGLELIASCEAGAYNAAAARALREQGATRLIFARELRLDEMAAIVADLADRPLACEAFVAREYCPNSSAVCLVAHGYGERGHFCCSPTRRLLCRPDGRPVRELADPLPTDGGARFWAALGALHRCGLCAIGPLLSLGVTHLKVPGRSSLALDAVALVRRVLDGDRSPEACRRLLDSPEFCDGTRCYYDLASAPLPRPPAPAPRAPLIEPSPRPRPVPPSDDGTPTLALYASLAGLSRAGARRLAAAPIAALASDDMPPWERAALAATLDLLPSLGVPAEARASRVFLGVEVCGHLLPTPRHLRAAVGWLRDAGLAVSLVTPVAYQGLWDALLRAIDALPEEVELIVNDPGLLLHAARLGRPVSGGRILDRMKRDQREGEDALPFADGIASLLPLDAAEREARLRAIRERQRLAYGHPGIAHPARLERLASLGVERLGLDALPSPLSAPLPARLAYDLYLPWAYLTSTRACPIAAAVEGAPLCHPTRRCRRACAHGILLPEIPGLRRRIVQRGAGTFMDCSGDARRFAASIAGGRLAHVVVEPRVPW